MTIATKQFKTSSQNQIIHKTAKISLLFTFENYFAKQVEYKSGWGFYKYQEAHAQGGECNE